MKAQRARQDLPRPFFIALSSFVLEKRYNFYFGLIDFLFFYAIMDIKEVFV